jgi:ACS family allantoate permease-like MFS transporter
MLPLYQICSGTQYADKVSTSTQATFGLLEDTHLVGQQYSCEYNNPAIRKNSQLTSLQGLSTIFYIAFLVSEAPANYILQRVSVGPTVACCMFIWGMLTFNRPDIQ